MKSLVTVIYVTLVLGFVSCNSTEKGNDTSMQELASEIISVSEEQIDVAGIQTGKLEKKLVADVVDCTGFIDVPPTNKAVVHAPIGGIIQSISVVPGMTVKKNQILATLSDQDIAQIQEEFLDLQSTLAYLKSEFQRKERLFKQDAIPQKDFLEAKRNFDVKRYEFESLKEQLAYLGISEDELNTNGISSKISIYSPLEGYVSEVYVNIGSYVDKNRKIFEIINYEHIHLELSVYANDISKIELNQLVRFHIVGSEKSGWGIIQLIGRKVDEANRSILVHAHIEQAGGDLTVGSSIMAEILTRADSAFSLPDEAIIKEGRLAFIYSTQDGGFIKTPVRLGRSYDGYNEILDYSSIMNKTIVTAGAYYLAE